MEDQPREMEQNRQAASIPSSSSTSRYIQRCMEWSDEEEGDESDDEEFRPSGGDQGGGDGRQLGELDGRQLGELEGSVEKDNREQQLQPQQQQQEHTEHIEHIEGQGQGQGRTRARNRPEISEEQQEEIEGRPIRKGNKTGKHRKSRNVGNGNNLFQFVDLENRNKSRKSRLVKWCHAVLRAVMNCQDYVPAGDYENIMINGEGQGEKVEEVEGGGARSRLGERSLAANRLLRLDGMAEYEKVLNSLTKKVLQEAVDAMNADFKEPPLIQTRIKVQRMLMWPKDYEGVEAGEEVVHLRASHIRDALSVLGLLDTVKEGEVLLQHLTGEEYLKDARYSFSLPPKKRRRTALHPFLTTKAEPQPNFNDAVFRAFPQGQVMVPSLLNLCARYGVGSS